MIVHFAYLITLIVTLDIFNYYFTNIFTGIGFYLILFLSFFLISFKLIGVSSSKYHRNMFIAFVTWIMIYVISNQFFANFMIYRVFLGIKINFITLGSFQIFSIFLVYLYLENLGKEKNKNQIVKIIIASFIVNAIITLIALQIDPNISKIMATGNLELNTNDLKGVSGYGTIYSIVIALPLLVVNLTQKKHFVFNLSIISLFIYLVYRSSFFIALFTMVIGLVFLLFLNTSRLFKLFLIPILIFVGIFMFNPIFLYDIFIDIADKIEIYELSARFKQVADFIKYNDDTGAALLRLSLYRKSIDAFLMYPITGIYLLTPDYTLSGHSAILDILGGSGLIGFVPFIMFLYYSLRISLSKTNYKYMKNAILTSYFMILIIATLNTLTYTSGILLVLLFFVTWFPSHFDKKYKRVTGVINGKNNYYTPL